MAPTGDIDLVAEYDGEPNGLKIHKDGRIFIADYRHGVMVLDPDSGSVVPFADLLPAESFKGLNDLVFASNGDLYFTDQGKAGLHDPTGRVYRFTADGRLEALIETLPGPNGLVLSPDEKVLYVGSRANAIWWQPLLERRPPARAGTFATMQGFGTPDGMAVDDAGDVVCVQHNMGVVWVFNRIGLPIWRIETCASDKLTNVAYGGPDRRDLYILDGNGKILVAHAGAGPHHVRAPMTSSRPLVARRGQATQGKLLVGMTGERRLVDVESEAGRRRQRDIAVLGLERVAADLAAELGEWQEIFGDDEVGHDRRRVHRHRQPEHHRVVVVGRDRDQIGLGHRRDLLERQDAAAVRDVGIDDVGGAPLEHRPKAVLGEDVLAGDHRDPRVRPDLGDRFEVSRPDGAPRTSRARTPRAAWQD
jgi:gluconolactonase